MSKLRHIKRFGKRARIWVRFADDTSESFSVPEHLAARFAAVVLHSYPAHVDVWVEGRRAGQNHVIRPDGRSFRDAIEDVFGGGHLIGPNVCNVCGCVADAQADNS